MNMNILKPKEISCLRGTQESDSIRYLEDSKQNCCPWWQRGLPKLWKPEFKHKAGSFICIPVSFCHKLSGRHMYAKCYGNIYSIIYR